MKHLDISNNQLKQTLINKSSAIKFIVKKILLDLK